ncbi:MAG: FkbM family methyltransferase [Pseudanabaenaceae cyanobacterium]
MSSLLGATHRLLSRQPAIVALALKLRNQCNRIIQCCLEDTANAAINGEEAWLRAIAPHCQTFVDVGANVGNWSAAFCQAMPAQGRGLLFEPSAAAQQVLQQRFAGDPRVEIAAVALSDTVGTAPFYEEPNAGETSSLVAQHSQSQAQVRWVPVTTLDRAIAERGWERVDFLKIDAEGYDFQVLRGAQRLLQQQKIGSLQFEYNLNTTPRGRWWAAPWGPPSTFWRASATKPFCSKPLACIALITPNTVNFSATPILSPYRPPYGRWWHPPSKPCGPSPDENRKAGC